MTDPASFIFFPTQAVFYLIKDDQTTNIWYHVMIRKEIFLIFLF